MESLPFQSLKPAEVGDEQYYKNLVNVYFPALQDKLDVEQITPHLTKYGLVTISELADLNMRARHSRRDAVTLLMKKLVTSDDPLWFIKFKSALRDSGQEIIYHLVNDEDLKYEEAFEVFLSMHFVVLMENIQPDRLLPELLQSRTITRPDFEVIMKENENRGQTAAAIKLLTTICCRKKGSFRDFVTTLKNQSYGAMLEEIDPGLLTARSDASLYYRVTEKRLENDLQKTAKGKTHTSQKSGTTCDIASSTTRVTCAQAPRVSGTEVAESNQRVKQAPEKTRQTRDVSSSTASFFVNAQAPTVSRATVGQTPNVSRAAQVQTPNVSRAAEGGEEVNCGSASCASEDDPEPLFHFKTDDELQQQYSSLCGDSHDKCHHSFSSHSRNNIKENFKVYDRSVTLDADIGQDELESHGLNLSLRSYDPQASEPRSSVSNQSSRNSSGNLASRKQPSLPASASIFSDSTLTSDCLDDVDELPIEKKELVLRGYQTELADEAVNGNNCLIVAPTGSGKTHVALYIAKRHLESGGIEEDRKIFFFVPKVALVLQQRRQFLTYLDNYQVTSVSGEKCMGVTLNELIETNDIIIMTPQILVNAIEEGNFSASFSQVTLMIFDECHHTRHLYPYNIIMGRYVDIVLRADEAEVSSLPQVVGLTASPGVGKAKNSQDAVNFILELCANLASSHISTVTREENLEELRKFVNVDVGAIQEVKGRQNDQFHTKISKIMMEIENKMNSRNDLNQLKKDAPNIMKVLQPPSQRGLESYTQFLAHLKREVAKIYDQEIRRFFLTCQEHLEVYNNGLLINADCRTIDALEFIKTRFHHMGLGPRHSLPEHEVDRWLTRLYTGKALDLEEISVSPESINPKLAFLERLILGYYRDNAESQGIIFCKTRYMTDALVKWMKDTRSLAFLNPHNLVGTGSTGASSGVSMTHRKLDDVLKYFKEGEHKIIVATSVAEEGLDVKSCNYVIRYEHVTNDIARIQSRGRARATDAKFVTVGEQGRGVQQREVMNQIREKLMNTAIFEINQMPLETMKSEILIKQRLAKQERDTTATCKEKMAEMKEWLAHDGDYQLRCFKCNTLGVWHTDLRTIKGSHHVVLDPSFKDRIEVIDHPRPKCYDDFEKKGKIHCRKCNIDWGISAKYKSVSVFLIKVCSFIVEDPDHMTQNYKKWKEVPFTVQELDLQEDLKALLEVSMGSL